MAVVEALAVAQTLGPAGMSGERQWRAWRKAGMRPAGVPSRPDQVYKDGGWQGWGHWLGTGNVQNGDQQFLPFNEALRVARCLRLNSAEEWRLWCRSGARPANVPADPSKTYKRGGWRGYVHWLGLANGPTAHLDTPAVAIAAGLSTANTCLFPASSTGDTVCTGHAGHAQGHVRVGGTYYKSDLASTAHVDARDDVVHAHTPSGRIKRKRKSTGDGEHGRQAGGADVHASIADVDTDDPCSFVAGKAENADTAVLPAGKEKSSRTRRKTINKCGAALRACAFVPGQAQAADVRSLDHVSTTLHRPGSRREMAFNGPVAGWACAEGAHHRSDTALFVAPHDLETFDHTIGWPAGGSLDQGVPAAVLDNYSHAESQQWGSDTGASSDGETTELDEGLSVAAAARPAAQRALDC